MTSLTPIVLRQDEFERFRALAYQAAGINLTEAKKQLVQSRLFKRLRHYGLSSFQEYLRLVDSEGENGNEMRYLINSLTTNKTDFFREPHHFRYISQTILPDMIDQAAHGRRARRIRVWHAGCSTGQEPYTNAMTIADTLRGQGMWDVRLLASDIDTDVLATAKEATYSAEQLEPVPAALKERYLKRVMGRMDQYQVTQDLRGMIAFRQINLNEDAWPIRADVRFDIIFCRNVVIYFDKPTQRKLFGRFQRLLVPGGYLFIGHSESLFGINDAFETVGGTIYRAPDETESVAR
ncbi:MAG: protein-glutamate O-methyltransferase [Capsulimonadaceae bacterium]|nr:protein-glutamate O-methyltransferase [Capsulimonadaceae bacterium]